MARFPDTWCSQCGRSFGAGNHGYSHCADHNNGKTEAEEITDLHELLDDRDDEQLRYETETGISHEPR